MENSDNEMRNILMIFVFLNWTHTKAICVFICIFIYLLFLFLRKKIVMIFKLHVSAIKNLHTKVQIVHAHMGVEVENALHSVIVD